MQAYQPDFDPLHPSEGQRQLFPSGSFLKHIDFPVQEFDSHSSDCSECLDKQGYATEGIDQA
jgi:hypothetical protein